MIPKFSIFYTDGERYDGGGRDDEVVTIEVSKKWLEARSDGVVAVVVEDPALNRVVLDSMDFYYQLPVNSDGAGYCGRTNSIGPFLRQVGLVKFGGWTATDNYREILGRAFSEKDYIGGDELGVATPEDDSTEDN